MYAQITKIQCNITKKMHETKRLETYQPLKKNQVIIKMANTILTPENPVFDFSSWYLEGLPYEKIIAMEIYYYKMTNITSNHLNFRATIHDPSDIDYLQNSVEYMR